MQRFKQIGSMACASMAVFLFSYSFSISFAAPKAYSSTQNEILACGGQLPVSPETQFPFEEKDEEAGDEFQNSLSLVCVLSETLSFVSALTIFYFIHQTFVPDHFSAHVPIYLAKRAIII